MPKRKRDQKVELSILERHALRDVIQVVLDDREASKSIKQWRVHALRRIEKKIPPVKV